MIHHINAWGNLNNHPVVFTKQLGHAIYRSIVSGTPWDTGNLAHSVKIRLNTEMKKKFTFVSAEADYVQSLEEGTSSHGKHKGFIEYGIMTDVIDDIIVYYERKGANVASLSHSRSRFLSSQAKSRGYGKGKVTVGRSRWARGETRKMRKQSSLSRQKP